MALVVLLRGVNVGGHRAFRPTTLAKQLKHLDAVNIGAAGSFVIRRPVTRAQLRTELRRRLPFDAEVMICQDREIVSLMSQSPFVDQPVSSDIVRFVSVLSRRPRSAPPMPMSLPSRRQWMLKILARDDRFVFGVYRRHMKVIGYLGTLDRLFGVPVTTRNWNTIAAIARVLGWGATRGEEQRERHMESKRGSQKEKSPSRLIDERIRELGDWRGQMLSRLRKLIQQADPEVVEEWKWGGPVWSHDGLICTGETYKSVVKMTFARGAALEDPAGLFNSSLQGNTRRAIDFHAGEKLDEAALKALIRAAVTLNANRR